MQFIMKMLMDADKAFQPSAELTGAIDKFMDETVRAGKLVQTGGMASTAKIVRINARNGKLNVIDGPYAETKEQVGGYAIVDVASREEAIELGRRFMEIHAKVLGQLFTADSEIQELFPMPLPGRK
ncbi:MAG TPA: YciI family protein [Spirochaetia bacterium]|nr:YciI family protein [Spirochaetia bacterium]